MSFLPGHFPSGGATGGFRDAVIDAVGAQISFTAATSYTAACTFGADDPSRQVLVLATTINTSATPDSGPSSVTVDGNAATRIYLSSASALFHGTVWLADYPSGASGNVVVARTGSNFASGQVGVFTILYGRDVANPLEVQYVVPAETVPVSRTMISRRGGVMASSINAANATLPLIYGGGLVEDLTDSVGAPNNRTVSLAIMNGISGSSVTPTVTTTPGPPNTLGPLLVSVR